MILHDPLADLFLSRIWEGISFPNSVERSIPDVPLSKLCAVPLVLQNRALFEGRRKGEKVPEEGRKRGGQQRRQKGKRTRENRSVGAQRTKKRKHRRQDIASLRQESPHVGILRDIEHAQLLQASNSSRQCASLSSEAKVARAPAPQSAISRIATPPAWYKRVKTVKGAKGILTKGIGKKHRKTGYFQGVFRVFQGIFRELSGYFQGVFRVLFPMPFPGMPFGPFQKQTEREKKRKERGKEWEREKERRE